MFNIQHCSVHIQPSTIFSKYDFKICASFLHNSRCNQGFNEESESLYKKQLTVSQQPNNSYFFTWTGDRVYVFTLGWYRSLPTNTLTKPPSFYHKKKTEKSFELHTCLNSLYLSGYAYPCDSCSAVLLPPGTGFLCGKMAGFLGTAGLQDGSRLSIPSTDHSFETQWYIL